MDRTNRWLTLAANIGVIVGLLLLVAEIRQNSNISEMAFYMDRRAQANQLNEYTLDLGVSEILRKAVMEPDELTLAEIEVFGSYLTLRLNSWRVTYVQEELGFREPGSADRYLGLTIQFTFGNPAALAWWRLNRDGFPAELRESVDAALENVDPNFTYHHITAMQEEFRNLPKAN